MLKRTLWLTTLLATLMLLGGGTVLADKPVSVDAQGNENAWSSTGCTNIQSGLLIDSAGNPLQMGFDKYGYNYQAHLFVGTYDSSDRVIDGTYFGDMADYVDDTLMMKWSDEWLANVDCNGDYKLDRGLVDGQYTDGKSKGWLTNMVEGDYSDADGIHHYTSFTKIVWTGTGPLWGAFTVIEDIYNDPAAGFHGVQSKIGAPGFGLNDQWTTTLP